MKLTQIAILLSGAALSASVLAADEARLGIRNIGDETDTSWQYTPQARPAFNSRPTATGSSAE